MSHCICENPYCKDAHPYRDHEWLHRVVRDQIQSLFHIGSPDHSDFVLAEEAILAAAESVYTGKRTASSSPEE